MKFILASLVALSFTAPAYAGTWHPKTMQITIKEHKTTKNCWKAKGNWVGGESYTSCEFSSGETITVAVPCKRPKAS